MLEKLKGRAARFIVEKFAQVIESAKTYYPYSSRSGVGALTSSGLKEGLSHTKALKQSDNLAIACGLMVDGVVFAEWEIVRGPTKTPVPDTHPAYQRLKKPNPFMSFEDMQEMVAYHWLLGGNGYMVETKVDVLGAPMEIWPFHPTCIRIEKDPQLFIKEYRALIEGKPVPIPNDRMHHVKFANPDDPYFGLGMVGRAERLFNNDIAMSVYAESYFENAAIPGTTVSSEGPLGDEERETIRETLDARHRGWFNTYKTLVLPKGSTINDMQKPPREVDFLGSKEASGKNIGALFRVGRVLMGRSDIGARATVDAELYMFHRLGVTPLLKRLAPHYTAIVQKFDKTLTFQFKDVVEADKLTDAQADQYDFGMSAITPNEIRERRGRKKIMKPGMDEVFMPMNLISMSDAMAPSIIPPALAPFTGQPPKPVPNDGTEPPKPGESEQAKPGEEGGEKPKPPEPPKSAAKRTYRRAFQYRFHRDSLRHKKYESGRWRSAFASFYAEEGERLAREYESAPKSVNIESIMKGEGWIEEHEQGVVRLTRRMYIPALGRDFKVQAELIGLADPASYGFEPGSADFSRAMSRLASDVKYIDSTTRADIADVIRQGAEMGLSPHEIAVGNPELDYRGIRGTFGQWQDHRSELIARTEASRVWDQAGLSAFEKMGVTSVDMVGCEDNVIFEGQTYGCNAQNVPIDEAARVKFHPNHRGTWAPRLEAYRELRLLTRPVEFDTISVR